MREVFDGRCFASSSDLGLAEGILNGAGRASISGGAAAWCSG